MSPPAPLDLGPWTRKAVCGGVPWASATMQTPSQVLAKPMFWVVDGLPLVCVVALACHSLLVVACQAEQPELEGSVSWSSQLLQCCYSSDIVLSLSPPMNGNRKRMVKRLPPAAGDWPQPGGLTPFWRHNERCTVAAGTGQGQASWQADPSMDAPTDAPAVLLGYLRERKSNGRGRGRAVSGWQPPEAGKLASLTVVQVQVQGVMQ
ncbi:hypothetical protein BN1708_006799 [Verticillium longisporum]|uniref:Uncharacterized protein n=1 Tax=Verticillium longisporum TaxID=100787 RepID=A0A0G4MP15_VERLO|nr:hypothetical protein BN1708_006799 [Verticillium longisporum]